MLRRDLCLADEPAIRLVVAQAGLACCTVEVDAAVADGLLVPAPDAPAGPVLLLVAGTITEPLVPALRALAGSLPPGSRAVAFGACATSGGPYWDAPMVVNGVDEVTGLPAVAAYVPGCPPSPAALIAALRELAGPAA